MTKKRGLTALGALTLIGMATITGCSVQAEEDSAPKATYTVQVAEDMLVHYFGEWGYPETDAVRQGTKNLLKQAERGCNDADEFLDSYVPAYVESFNSRLGPSDPPMSESNLRWGLESAIVVVCEAKQ